jgi:peptidoglycan/LPS O-acetylase OafA/YrhL
MFAVLRLFALLFAVLTLLYMIMSFMLRQIALKEAREEWEALDARINWETYLERQMKVHNRSMKRKLIVGVYILPSALVASLVYFVNFA